MRDALWLLAVAILVSSAALAEVEGSHVSISPYAGATFWAEDVGLENSSLFGARAAAMVNSWVGLEATYGTSGSQTEFGTGFDTSVRHLGVDVTCDLMPASRLVPYLSGGWSQLTYDSESGNDVTGDTPYVFKGWEFGGGVRYRVVDRLASQMDLRLDVRDVMTDLVRWFPDSEDSHHNIMLSAGLQMAFGKPAADSDGDGIADRRDSCPSTPDLARVDRNGCPLDTDGDGVYDGLDLCNNTAPGDQVDSEGCSIPPALPQRAAVEPAPATAPGTDLAARQTAQPTTEPATRPARSVETAPEPPPTTQPAIPGDFDPDRIETVEVYFKKGSDWVDFQQRKRLDAVGKLMLEWPKLELEVGGCADASGDADLNKRMARARAQEVVDYLTRRFPGISPSRFFVVSYGEWNPTTEQPAAQDNSADRRVQLRIVAPPEYARERR